MMVFALPLLLSSLALASPAERLLPWGSPALRPASVESPAIGPDLLAVGPDGALALWDPADQAIWLVEDGATPRAISASSVDDLAWTDTGLLILDDRGRNLSLINDKGALLDEMALPGLVPVGCQLSVSGAAIYAQDVFGNLHALATLDGDGLSAARGPALRAPEIRVRWDAVAHRMSAGQRSLALPDAIKASGRVLGAGDAAWLVVDEVVSDAPIRVRRVAVPVAGGSALTLDSSGRLYAPTRDVAVGGDGRIVWMVPRADGLHVYEVSP